EKVQPLPAYRDVLEDGSLLLALEDAALLVRLLNDMGTLLLEQPTNDRKALIQTLYHMHHTGDFPTFEHLLLDVAGQQGTLLTRMNKDIRFGEFNVCLHSVRQVNDIATAIEVFADQLESLTLVYEDRLQRLPGMVAQLNQRLGSTFAGEVILRF